MAFCLSATEVAMGLAKESQRAYMQLHEDLSDRSESLSHPSKIHTGTAADWHTTLGWPMGSGFELLPLNIAADHRHL